MGQEGSHPPDTPITGLARGWLHDIGKEDREECSWGSGVETRGQEGAKVEDLGGKEGEMQEWDLVGEFFSPIRDLHEDEEDKRKSRGEWGLSCRLLLFSFVFLLFILRVFRLGNCE